MDPGTRKHTLDMTSYNQVNATKVLSLDRGKKERKDEEKEKWKERRIKRKEKGKEEEKEQKEGKRKK